MADWTPADPAPSPAAQAPSSIASLGQTPWLVTGILVQLLRQHFADRSAIADPALRDLAWRPEAGLDGSPGWVAPDPLALVIESASTWRPELAGAAPALVVRRDPCRNESLGIGDERMGWYEPEGYQVFEDQAVGSHTVFCVAAEPDEAEHLAAETSQELKRFSSVFRRWYGFRRFKYAGDGGVGTLKEDPDKHCVPLTVAWVAPDVWTVDYEAPKLKRIELEAILASI